MNRTELVEAVAARAGSDQAAARRHVDAVFEAIMESVAAGDRVLVTGFGSFDRLSRPARTARNPRTGLPIDVPAAEVPRFRVGQSFKNLVANGTAEAEVAEAPLAKEAKESKKAKKPKKASASASVKAKDKDKDKGKKKGKGKK